MTAPAARSRRTTSESAAAGVLFDVPPNVVTHPSTSFSSLMAIGTPCSGPSGSAAASRSAASARARSASTTEKALSSGSRLSIAARHSSTRLPGSQLSGCDLTGGLGDAQGGGHRRRLVAAEERRQVAQHQRRPDEVGDGRRLQPAGGPPLEAEQAPHRRGGEHQGRVAGGRGGEACRRPSTTPPGCGCAARRRGRRGRTPPRPGRWPAWSAAPGGRRPRRRRRGRRRSRRRARGSGARPVRRRRRAPKAPTPVATGARTGPPDRLVAGLDPAQVQRPRRQPADRPQRRRPRRREVEPAGPGPGGERRAEQARTGERRRRPPPAAGGGVPLPTRPRSDRTTWLNGFGSSRSRRARTLTSLTAVPSLCERRPHRVVVRHRREGHDLLDGGVADDHLVDHRVDQVAPGLRVDVGDERQPQRGQSRRQQRDLHDRQRVAPRWPRRASSCRRTRAPRTRRPRRSARWPRGGPSTPTR